MKPLPESSWKRWRHGLVPPMVRAWARRWRDGPGFVGNFGSWGEAVRASGGYEAPAILERVTAAARQVRDGAAAYERDSVVFTEANCQWPLLACLLDARARRGGDLDLVDFGGSLGSLYFQHRAWLKGVGRVRWRVVEQPQFVAAGRREFATEELSFHATLGEACAGGAPAGILFSSVLPYLETPYATLADALGRGFSFVIVDRTGFVAGAQDRLTVQHVPPRIYPASYPCWFLARERFLAAFARDYDLKMEFANEERANLDADYRGFYFARRS